MKGSWHYLSWDDTTVYLWSVEGTAALIFAVKNWEECGWPCEGIGHCTTIFHN